ncbi:MAG: lipid-A-disaccharide synthase [Legionellaceae bacterium]|nr:lipid-A-disaccharide synthase [Legionellaceae bacterium]
MQPSKRIVIVAGEESGDVHAAAFIRELKQRNSNINFSGIGGQHMKDAGADIICNLACFGTTGISEVIRNARVLYRAFQDIKVHLEKQKPDLLILVDFPGFNLRLAKFAKLNLNIRILYYISPQIWAWKANRIHTIRAYIDKMAVILPFEKIIYEKGGVPASFVGHPLVDKILVNQDVTELKSRLKIPSNKRIIAMLPGSRSNEIVRLMPVLFDAAKQLIQKHPDLHFVIPVARTIKSELIESYLANSTLPYSLIQEQASEVVYCSDFAVVASGTASLECALLIKPMCIIYKASWLTYLAASKLIRVRFLGLCNLLQNQMIVPELLQYDCNATELARSISTLMTNSELSNRMITRLQALKLSLSTQQADFTISSLIESEIGTLA